MLEICSQINGGSDMIERALQQTIHEKLWQDKAILIMGARQVGNLIRKHISNSLKIYIRTKENYHH